jgi:hypothetical protein
MAITPSTNFPSLLEIANLVRSFVDDDKRGFTGTPGEGQILVNLTSGVAATALPQFVTLTNFMNSAIREVRRDCGIMGQPTFIRDNYLLLGLPPVNSSLGVGVMNPETQQSLTNVGFFDGVNMNPQFILPADMLQPLELWERLTGTVNPFTEMRESRGALRPRNQVNALHDWEYRGNAIYFNGAILSRDVRMRYIGSLASLATSTIDWSETFIPIPDCHEAVADKIAVRYGRRLGSPQTAELTQQADRSMLRLRQTVVRARQRIDNKRPEFSGSGNNQLGIGSFQ